jgi:hypothetical protein
MPEKSVSFLFHSQAGVRGYKSADRFAGKGKTTDETGAKMDAFRIQKKFNGTLVGLGCQLHPPCSSEAGTIQRDKWPLSKTCVFLLLSEVNYLVKRVKTQPLRPTNKTNTPHFTVTRGKQILHNVKNI